jgi:FAD:protein FMN transferase
MNSPSSEVRRARPLLGTFVEIVVDQLSLWESNRAIDAAFQAIEEVQYRMSFHDPGSTLSFLNRNAGHVPVPIDEWTFTVLETAAEVHRISQGAFDVTIAPHLQALGFLPSYEPSPLSCPSGRASFTDVELLPDRHVRFRNPKVRIDLGGIAKGFAIDQSVAQLQRSGVKRGLVNAGGDLRAFGEAGFPVSIRHPEHPGSTLLSFSVANSALATSSHCFVHRYHRGSQLGPIIDARTARPVDTIRSVTVRASNAMVADALTKVVMICGEAALPVLNHFHADSLFVSGEGISLCSSGWYATLDLSS